jgi:predicted nucleotidyltransferase
MRAFNVTLRQAQGDCHGELVEPCLSNYAHVNMTEETRKIPEILERKQNVSFAYIFGSRVKGFADKRSDCDLAIYFCKDPRKLPGWIVFQFEAEIAKEIGMETHITILNGLSAPVFAFQIISDGILLIDKEPEKRILYGASAIKRYHDWRYFLKRHIDTYQPSLM